MESVIEFLNMFIDQASDIGNTLDSYWERMLHWVLIGYLKVKMFALESAYEIASALLTNLGISEVINSAWSSLDNQLVQGLTYLRIPEGINMLLNAALTRFILGLMP